MEQNKKQFIITEDLLARQGQRFANYLIDGIAQFILMIVIAVFITAMGSEKAIYFLKNIDKNDLALYTLSIGVTLIYYNFFEIFLARTIGKIITGTVVVDEYGKKPDYQTIMIRSLCRLLPFFPLSFLGIPPKGWHDRISKTYVVNKKDLQKAKELFESLSEIGQNNN